MVVYFFRDIVRIIRAWFLALFGRIPRSDPDARMGWFVIVGSIPIVVLGVLFQSAIETTLRSLWIVAVTLIVFGILLGIADRIGSQRRGLDDLTLGHGIVYGLAQSLALIPGVSRSGGTITAGLLLGYERAAAARYSFLLAIPAVFGSGFFELYKVVKGECAGVVTASGGCGAQPFSGLDIAAATAVAFVVGLVVIAFFMRYISKRTFLPFVVYRIVLGLVLVVLLATNTIAA